MHIGALHVDIYLTEIFSLKEKRYVLQSLKTRIQNNFNVSVAEVEFNDKWQRSRLGIVCVSNAQKHNQQVLAKVLHFIEQENRVEIIDQLQEHF